MPDKEVLNHYFRLSKNSDRHLCIRDTSSIKDISWLQNFSIIKANSLEVPNPLMSAENNL